MNLSNNNLISKDKIKDVLLNKTAAKTNTATSEVEKLIGFVFKDASKAFRTGNSVEISGFGVFKFSLKKLKKDVELKERQLKTLIKQYEKKPKDITKRWIDTLETFIADAKTKINELEKD
jgi:nucleoid DNA-binding protein